MAHVASRGIRVLVDKDGELGSRLAELPEPAPPSPPNEAALRELAADFFYHAVWAARKLRRGEVFTAKRCVDSYMENVLIRILEWRTHAENPDVDTWHAGRFIERWADPATLDEFRGTFAAYDEADVRRALFATMDFFRRQARETAELLDPDTRRRRTIRHERCAELASRLEDGATPSGPCSGLPARIGKDASGRCPQATGSAASESPRRTEEPTGLPVGPLLPTAVLHGGLGLRRAEPVCVALRHATPSKRKGHPLRWPFPGY